MNFDVITIVGLVTVALTNAIKARFPLVTGEVTILVATVVGGVVGYVGQLLGFAGFEVVAGATAGLTAAGAVAGVRVLRGDK